MSASCQICCQSIFKMSDGRWSHHSGTAAQDCQNLRQRKAPIFDGQRIEPWNEEA